MTTMVAQLRDWADRLDGRSGLYAHATPEVVCGVVVGLRAVADDIERTPQAVWVLEVTHKHGADITVHATERSARETLAAYCLDWWEPLFTEENWVDPETLSEDQVIQQYFEAVDGHESFDIVSAQVQP